MREDVEKMLMCNVVSINIKTSMLIDLARLQAGFLTETEARKLLAEHAGQLQQVVDVLSETKPKDN